MFVHFLYEMTLGQAAKVQCFLQLSFEGKHKVKGSSTDAFQLLAGEAGSCC